MSSSDDEKGARSSASRPAFDSHRTIDSDALKIPGAGGWPPDQEKLPFLFRIDFYESFWDQKGKPQGYSLGLKDPCVINHFVQE